MNEAANTGSHFVTLALLALYWVLLSFLPQMLSGPDGGMTGQKRGQAAGKKGPATAPSLALEAVRKVDRLFDEASFLRGALDAYESILKAYAAGDLTPVQRFVGPAVLEVFQSAIAERRQRQETLELMVVSIKAATIVDALGEGDTVEIVVRYGSEMISVTRSADNLVVAGDPMRIIQVTDVWTFARSSQSAWALIATDCG
ncbi:Tim44/TimA family putative adaptor protein [Mesorhizobium sp. WSM3860]|uniref:Tim44/TimA family putative adaptor protein n=1 Tax=Mesorhizobium sp. WSM3860 TaxID=2029403 RepID=UPI000BAE6F02|nr:Tim44/TimA family putative adaptor protein [Mesorhizobium sp. WSM3860]PBC03670.1 hypothetical protein CK220_13965 [Mesorhizobium sp. WSM3860]